MVRAPMLILLLALAALLPACSTGGSATGTTATHSPASGAPLRTLDYLPGVAADLHAPSRSAADVPVNVVVMVPGGAWLTADRAGLTGLAEHLAAGGVFVVNATHRAVNDGARFPGPVQDVVCSAGFAVAQAQNDGYDVGRVVLLGHSSGAHLAALAALATDEFRAECGDPPATIGGLIGLAGTYDVTQLGDLAEPFFGAPRAAAKALWQRGNALALAEARPDVPVLLAHGDADDLLPTFFTTAFGDALKRGGHDVQVEIVGGAGHLEVFRAEVIGDVVLRWLAALG